MSTDSTTLFVFLAWVVEGGGAGVAAYFLMEKVKALASLNPEAKRYVSLALAGILAMGVFVLTVFLGYTPQPADAQGWLESLFAVAFLATNLSQIIHGRTKLRD